MKPTLVVLAAGIGSRYGGIKQIEQVGPNRESLIDYSIYNAIKAGFGKVILVIRKNIEADIRNFFKNKIPQSVEIHYVYQGLDTIPQQFSVPTKREKPWGTGHALLMCKDIVQEPFAMINGDDYYAYEALKILSDFLNTVEPTHPSYAIVGYELKRTLSKHGSVSRGICKVDEHNNLINLEEHKTVLYNAQGNIVSQRDGEDDIVLTGTEPASMNLFGFTPVFLSQLEKGFNEFLQHHGQELKSEFYVPEYLGELTQKSLATISLFTTNAQWFGVTYKEDKSIVMNALQALVDQGMYPANLWGTDS